MLIWRGVVQKTSPLLTQRGRGGDKEFGEDRKINQDAIWHPSTLETPTTVCTPSVPLHSLRDESHKWPQIQTEKSVVVWMWLMETEAACTDVCKATRCKYSHGKPFLPVHVVFSAGEHTKCKCADTLSQLELLFSFNLMFQCDKMYF